MILLPLINDRIVIAWQWRVLPYVALIPVFIFLIDALYRLAHHSTKGSDEP